MLRDFLSLVASYCFLPVVHDHLCEPAYKAARDECEHRFSRVRPGGFSINKQCFPSVFMIDNLSVTTSPTPYWSGFYGEVFRTNLPDVLVKMANGAGLSICNERAALQVLDGYQGFVPRVFPITSELSDNCSSELFAMERVGEADWDDIVKVEGRSFYLRMARLLEIIMSLHEFGFVHKDLSGRNIRVGLESEDQVYLVDLATVCTWNRKGNCARKLDMIRVTDLAMDVRGSHNWRMEYQLEMFHMDPHARPNYEYWIAYFRQRASQI